MVEEVYTHGHHDSVLRSHRSRTVANSAAYLADRLRPGTVVLDVGCGPGTITVDIARRVAPGRVVGIDASADAFEEARRRADEAGVTNVTFAAGDVYALDHPDGEFDVVHAHQVLQHLADPPAALREMGRVCRPGGVVAARDADYAGMTWYPESPGLDAWMALYQRVARLNGGEPDAGRRMLAWAREAGFTDIEARASVWCYATPDEREWWSGVWKERILHSAIAEQALAAGLATPEDLQRISTAWKEWGADGDGWFAIVHGEILAHV